VSKVEMYRRKLRDLPKWDDFLLRESGLPGPRGNLELAAAVVEEAAEGDLDGYLVYGPAEAPEGTAEEFLAFCGVLGLSAGLPRGGQPALRRLRSWASDPRWRIREAVAMALQRFGDRDMRRLLATLDGWVGGNCLERRAVIAAVAEPRLLTKSDHARAALALVDRVTQSLLREADRRHPDVRVLRQGLGYAWSVVVAADPEAGMHCMESWLRSKDADIRWVMRQNLGKARLTKAAPQWVAHWRAKLA